MFPNGSFSATSFGPCCPQRDAGLYIPMQDEQCLNLNIFTPKVTVNQSLLPVLVWIHGGGLQSGCSSQSILRIYNGTNIIAHSLQQQPVIVVTINYRLGVLGDMYLLELAEENSSEWPTAGNYYYLDMLSALRWINRNIRDYGGNPSNVLLFGESSGANAVVDLGALKGSSNLYQHVISQSGGAGNYLYYTNKSDALDVSNKIVQTMNCSKGNSEMTLACLRNSSIENLVTAYGDRQTKPIVDGYFFPFYPPTAIEKGKYNQNLTIMLGNNDYEHPLCFQAPDMNSTDALSILIQSIGQRWAPLVADQFQVKNCSSNRNAKNRCCNVLRLLLMNKLFDCNVRRIYNNLYSKYGPQKNLFWFHFDCNPGICPQLPVEGSGLCTHTAEIPYVFGTVSTYYSTESLNCTWDNQSQIFSNQVISHWVNTATTGKPLNQWPYYDPSMLKYFYITPYQDFAAVSWNGSCSIFDQIEQEEISYMFKNKSSSYYKNIDTIIFFVLPFSFLFFSFINDSIHHYL
ncbi:unnamed protein product [Rotaria magnacalcarata]